MSVTDTPIETAVPVAVQAMKRSIEVSITPSWNAQIQGQLQAVSKAASTLQPGGTGGGGGGGQQQEQAGAGGAAAPPKWNQQGALLARRRGRPWPLQVSRRSCTLSIRQ